MLQRTARPTAAALLIAPNKRRNLLQQSLFKIVKKNIIQVGFLQAMIKTL